MDGDQLTSLGGVPIEYVGKKPNKVDNIANTGLTWAPGQIHIVPPLVALKLLVPAYADIWREADLQAMEEDPSRVGIVVETEHLGMGKHDETGQEEPEQIPQTFDLPNLHGMTKSDLQTFSASQFNYQLASAMKKEDMINQIVTLANSRAAGSAV